ncbi:MAG: hypothetical protein AAFV36_08500 [Myxococcota bacterium]
MSTVESAPSIQLADAMRRGRRIKLRLKWSSVKDAERYEVQLSRSLTFAAISFSVTTKKRALTTRAMASGLYFVRVRGLGDGGPGAWSAARAVAARSRGRARYRPLPRLPNRGDKPPQARQKDTPVSPLTLRLTRAEARILSSAPSIELTGEATKGARVEANGRSTIATPAFALTVKLEHGRNDVTVSAQRGKERRETKRVVYYADPRQVQKQLSELTALRKQLDELRQLQREIHAASVQVQRAQSGASSKEVDELGAELAEIEVLATQLRAEIDRAFEGVQRLLTASNRE